MLNFHKSQSNIDNNPLFAGILGPFSCLSRKASFSAWRPVTRIVANKGAVPGLALALAPENANPLPSMPCGCSLVERIFQDYLIVWSCLCVISPWWNTASSSFAVTQMPVATVFTDFRRNRVTDVNGCSSFRQSEKTLCHPLPTLKRWYVDHISRTIVLLVRVSERELCWRTWMQSPDGSSNQIWSPQSIPFPRQSSWRLHKSQQVQNGVPVAAPSHNQDNPNEKRTSLWNKGILIR